MLLKYGVTKTLKFLSGFSFSFKWFLAVICGFFFVNYLNENELATDYLHLNISDQIILLLFHGRYFEYTF